MAAHIHAKLMMQYAKDAEAAQAHADALNAICRGDVE